MSITAPSRNNHASLALLAQAEAQTHASNLDDLPDANAKPCNRGHDTHVLMP